MDIKLGSKVTTINKPYLNGKIEIVTEVLGNDLFRVKYKINKERIFHKVQLKLVKGE